jgi:hypothetical protein
MTGGIEKKLKGHGIANLRQLLLMDKDQLARLKLPKRTVKALRSQPYASAENISLGFETDKTTGTNIGHLQLDVVKHIEGIDYVSKDKKKAGFSYNVVVGTPQKNVLLANKSVFLSDMEKMSRKSIELSFNWSLANSFGGKNGGHIIVRILSDHFRGVDAEYVVPF